MARNVTAGTYTIQSINNPTYLELFTGDPSVLKDSNVLSRTRVIHRPPSRDASQKWELIWSVDAWTLKNKGSDTFLSFDPGETDYERVLTDSSDPYMWYIQPDPMIPSVFQISTTSQDYIASGESCDDVFYVWPEDGGLINRRFVLYQEYFDSDSES